MGKYDTELSDAIAKMDAFWKDFEAQKAQREARRKAWTDLRASGLLYTSPEAWESAKAEAEEAAEREAHRHPVRQRRSGHATPCSSEGGPTTVSPSSPVCSTGCTAG